MSGYRGKHTAQNRRNAVRWAVGAAVVLALLAGAVFLMRTSRRAADPDRSIGSSSEVLDGVGSTSGSGSSASSEPTHGLDVSASVPEADPPPPYDFSRPAPESEGVDNSYFDDAAFVGDSRTDGFMLYSGIGTGKNLTSNGLSIFRLGSKKALTIGGEKYTLLEALALERYGKVYLSLGVNELGYHNDKGFYDSYCVAIDEIRNLQPEAVIYIQGLIPLNEGQIMAASGNEYLTNEHLRAYNELMRQAAEEKQVVFLDLYNEFADENNELPEGASRDGVHLGKEYCQRWLAYLKTHTVAFDTLYPDGPPVVETPEPEPDPTTVDGSGDG